MTERSSKSRTNACSQAGKRPRIIGATFSRVKATMSRLVTASGNARYRVRLWTAAISAERSAARPQWIRARKSLPGSLRKEGPHKRRMKQRC